MKIVLSILEIVKDIGNLIILTEAGANRGWFDQDLG